MDMVLTGWGCRVLKAPDLATAVASIDEIAFTPRALLVDYHLDESNGVDAIAELRRRYGADLTAILITADRSPDVRQEAQRHGIVLLNKPVKPAALRALITQVRITRAVAARISLSLPSFQCQPDAPSRPAGRPGRCRSAAPARTAPGRASPTRGRRRRGVPRRSRREPGRRAPRCRRRGSGATPPSRSGSAISVSTATTPSRPGLKSATSLIRAGRYLTGIPTAHRYDPPRGWAIA